MTTIRHVPAKDVQPGDVVLSHGIHWCVTANRFDPYGNTGNQPRHILVADATEESARLPGVGYIKGMTLGFLPNGPVPVVIEAALLGGPQASPVSHAKRDQAN